MAVKYIWLIFINLDWIWIKIRIQGSQVNLINFHKPRLNLNEDSYSERNIQKIQNLKIQEKKKYIN